MSRIRVFGIGSPFGDDQIGTKVIAKLQQQAQLQKYIPEFLHLEICDRPGVSLLYLMRGAEIVFLVDAIITGANIGTLHRLDNQKIETYSHIYSTHDIGVAETLKLGRILNELPAEIILYGVEIEEVTSDFIISKKILQAMDVLVKKLSEEILSAITKISKNA